MLLFVWALIAAVTVMRAIAIFSLPLTGDEAYYWEWSRRLAFGYVDHPPAVAWTIAAFSWIGSNPGFVRLGFVLSGVVATLAIAACATEIAQDRRAGGAAALAFTLTPLMSLAFGMATPDGPYLACWCVALWLGARAFRRNERWTWIALGVALGGVVLARFFGWALLAGIAAYALVPARRHAWRDGLWLTFVVAGVIYAPFVAWNADHQWATFDFTFLGRHELRTFSLKRVVDMYLVQAAAYSPGLWIGALFCLVRPRNALLAWTSIPLIALVTLLAFIERVEIHWIFGAYATLCVAMGLAYMQLSRRARVIWATAASVPSLVLLPALFAATQAPGDVYQAFRNQGSVLRNTGPWEIYTTEQLARNVKIIAGERHAIVMTDGYGLSSVLDYYAGIEPVVIGYDWQGAEARRWVDHIDGPTTGLFVDKESLVYLDPEHRGRPDFEKQLRRACRHVRLGSTLHYDAGMGVPPRAYYLTWCDGLTDGGLATLRWENGAVARHQTLASLK
ncbi:MAG: glycosyltransferase family 39 protein [Candidatus Eremiobacteraeota bacterium]|nr:glycosyltransferase family 39 protein [Candidatus Eremiobacteraeota bacterium]MBV8355226.1 glycosyltransferase family 39 protein [Candidatus Eremiobacteraeota bacterium]